MKRSILWSLITMTLLASLMLGACAQATATPEPTTPPEPTAVPTAVPTEPPAAPETTLVIWADETRAPILQALADEFEAAYGVGLEVQQVADINDQYPIAAPAGEGPDIFIGPHDRLGGWVSSGLLAPIDLGAKSDQFLPVTLTAFTYDSKLYGMPYAFENMALFRNADMVPEAPATWADLLQVGADLQTAGEVTYALALEDNGYKVYPILTSFGGYVFGRDDAGNWNPNDLGIDSPGMIAAGDWITENVTAGLISPNANDADNRPMGARTLPDGRDELRHQPLPKRWAILQWHSGIHDQRLQREHPACSGIPDGVCRYGRHDAETVCCRCPAICVLASA
jgi:maltose-binding protein MalE